MAAAMSLIKRERKLSRKSLTGWRAESNGGYDFQFFHADQLDMYAREQSQQLNLSQYTQLLLSISHDFFSSSLLQTSREHFVEKNSTSLHASVLSSPTPLSYLQTDR